jgi:ribosome maturation factor RimP
MAMWGSSPTFFFGIMAISSDPLLEAVRRHVAELGFELIEFRRSGPPARPAIKLRIDRPGSTPGHGVTAGDCQTVSRALERGLIAAGPAGMQPELEVSSPGIERPVRFPEHWQRYVGRKVKVTARGVAGSPVAEIVQVHADAEVELRLPDGQLSRVALSDIKEALLSDESLPAIPRRGRKV